MKKTLANTLDKKDKDILGDAKYLTVVSYLKDIHVLGIKVLIFLDTDVKYKSLPFLAHSLSYWCRFSGTSYGVGLRALVSGGYIERLKRDQYKITQKGFSFITGYWITHGLKVAKLTASK